MSKRNRYDEAYKKQIATLFVTQQKSVPQLLKEMRVPRHQVYRWANEYYPDWRKQHEQSAPAVNHSPLLANTTRAKHDPRDLLILQLKEHLADLMLENKRLSAGLNGNRRYTDRRYISDGDGVQDGN